MADTAPKLGDIPQHSDMNIPALSSEQKAANAPAANGNTVQNAKDTIVSNTQSAMNTIQNHPATQSVKETMTQGMTDGSDIITVTDVREGPVAEHAKDQAAKTQSDLRGLANSRTTPSQPAATGQPLTNYHSLFYNLLSWKNPRATAITFASSIIFIFAARYLPLTRWTFRVLYLVLGVTATAEVLGKLVLSQGLASSFRPRRYYTIPHEALESILEDVEQLINFFVIEFQRIVFAENVIHTIAAFSASVLGYWLIKFLPLWGLSLIATSVIYLGPLIYINNQELIDTHLSNAQQVVNSQASQVKDLAGHHTARATETVRQYAGDYSAKAQEYIGSAKRRSTSPEMSKPTIKSEPGVGNDVKATDFPAAPKQEPVAESAPKVNGGKPIPAS